MTLSSCVSHGLQSCSCVDFTCKRRADLQNTHDSRRILQFGNATPVKTPIKTQTAVQKPQAKAMPLSSLQTSLTPATISLTSTSKSTAFTSVVKTTTTPVSNNSSTSKVRIPCMHPCAQLYPCFLEFICQLKTLFVKCIPYHFVVIRFVLPNA